MARQAEETLSMPLPLSEAYQRCLGAADAIPRSKLKSADQAVNRLELRTKMSFKSFGEKVELLLSPEGESSTRVHVLSKAVVPTTLVDYGKNRGNVNCVVSWLLRTRAES
jgi:hypothetical protein